MVYIMVLISEVFLESAYFMVFFAAFGAALPVNGWHITANNRSK
jgi:hypothetical protein